jgi:hypothetical protein
MELMDGGCLTDILDQYEDVKLTERQIARVCRSVGVYLISFRIYISH